MRYNPIRSNAAQGDVTSERTGRRRAGWPVALHPENGASTGVREEVCTGDFIFENEWQSSRIWKDRSLELASAYRECAPGRRKLAVKIVDNFGNDIITIVEATI